MGVCWLEQNLADISGYDAWLSAAERLRCDAFRIPKRRSDWRLGRWTAKRAVAACLNLPHDPESLAAIEIRPDPSGAPEVFLRDHPASISISLSHSAGIAACIVGPPGARLGCDLELVEPRGSAFVADYFTAGEQELISCAANSARDMLATLLWSAKESALKALRTGLRLDTRCIAVTISNETRLLNNTWLPLSVCCPDQEVLQGWWKASGEFVRTVVTNPALGPPVSLSEWSESRLVNR